MSNKVFLDVVVESIVKFLNICVKFVFIGGFKMWLGKVKEVFVKLVIVCGYVYVVMFFVKG